MINTRMKVYDVFKYNTLDSYGQPTLSLYKNGTIKMDINLITQSISDNQLYSSAQYVGITLGTIENDCVVKSETQQFKVIYTNTLGRYNQVWMVLL